MQVATKLKIDLLCGVGVEIDFVYRFTMNIESFYDLILIDESTLAGQAGNPYTRAQTVYFTLYSRCSDMLFSNCYSIN